jgi:microcystin-dependent protein
MTVTTTANKVVYTGNGATTNWPFSFPIPALADIQVSLVNISSGNETILAPTLYTVAGLGGTSGSVTYPLTGSPLAATSYLVIQRIMPLEQQTTFANQGAAYPADIEAGLDYLTMVTQQLQDSLNRAIIFSAADTVEVDLPTATARANKFLGFNSSGDPVAVDGLTAGTTVSAAMIPVVTAPTTAAALTALGIPGALLDQLIPAGTIWEYSLTSAPTGFVFPSGQACTSTYPTYRAALVAAGSPYGSNGTDPLMPDLRSMVTAGKSNMNGVDNGLLTGGTVLGGIIGTQLRTLLTANLPAYTPTGSVPSITVDSNNWTASSTDSVVGSCQPGGNQVGVPFVPGGTYAKLRSVGSGTFTGVAQGGSSTAFSLVQPTIVLNKIIKVH